MIQGSAIAPFTLAVPKPTGEWLPALEAALLADGPAPVRWAIVAATGDMLTIEGARACSPLSS